MMYIGHIHLKISIPNPTLRKMIKEEKSYYIRTIINTFANFIICIERNDYIIKEINKKKIFTAKKYLIKPPVWRGCWFYKVDQQKKLDNSSITYIRLHISILNNVQDS